MQPTTHIAPHPCPTCGAELHGFYGGLPGAIPPIGHIMVATCCGAVVTIDRMMDIVMASDEQLERCSPRHLIHIMKMRAQVERSMEGEVP